MKRFLLLLAAVGLVSCSETLDAGGPNEVPSQLEELQKRFDFSEVDMEGLEISEIHEYKDDDFYSSDSFEYQHSDLAVVIGKTNDCFWLGLFDRESGKLKYQYTDVDHPTSYSYSAYGVEYKYEYKIGEIFGIYFERDNVVLAIQYFIKESDKARLDLIAFDENEKALRTTIFENVSSYLSCYGHLINNIFAIYQWSANTIYFYPGFGMYPEYAARKVIYDFKKKEILCNIFDPNPIYLRASCPNFTSISNPLHCWYIDICQKNYPEKIFIEEHLYTYDYATIINKKIELFEPYTGDSSKAPRYSYEYKIKTEDYALVVVTQTEYDGTATTKTVEVRLENDELKVEVL